MGKVWWFWRYSDLVKRVKFGVSGYFGHALHVDFPHYGASLTETGHIWGFRTLSGERVGVNVEGGGGGGGHISDALSGYICDFILVYKQS